MDDLNEEIIDNEKNKTINQEEKLYPCRCPECYLIPSITM